MKAIDNKELIIALEELEKEKIKVAIIPHYDDVKDADEYYNKYGMNAFLLKVQNPISVFDFYLQEMDSFIHVNNFEDRKVFAKKMCHYLASKDVLEIDFYLDRLAEKLKFSKPALLQLVEQEKKPELEIKTNFHLIRFTSFTSFTSLNCFQTQPFPSQNDLARIMDG